jgi:molybdopterin/thiamine biosynthesis adenylyltransferase
MTTPRLREIQLEATPALTAARRLDRSARTPAFLDVAREKSEALARNVDALAISAGSVALPAIEAVAHMGVRSFTIVDPAHFKPESLITHATLSAEEVGLSKAEVAGRRVKAASPRTRVLVFEGPFEALPISVAANASLWLAAPDNLKVELAISQAALELGPMLVQGSVWGAGLIAQVRSLAPSPDGSGPSLCCGYGSAEWEQVAADTRFSCSGDSDPSAAWAPSQIPTRSVAPLCATTGNLVALEATRWMLGIGDPEASRMIQLCGYDFSSTITPLRRRDDCPLSHRSLRRLPERDCIGQRSARELIERAGYGDADPHRVTLTVPGRRFARLTACHCDKHEVLERFVQIAGSAGRCRRCGAERVAHVLHSFDEVPASALGSRLDRSLASLGAPAPESVRVRSDGEACLFYRALPEFGLPQELAS